MFSRHLLILAYFYFYLCNNEVKCRCDNIKASVSQRIMKDGFHREIEYIVSLSEEDGHDIWSPGMCRLNLKQRLPAGAYVNADELQELKRFHKVHACPVGNIDIEKPKHMSRPIVVHIYSAINSSQVILNLPIHIRYHKAKIKGGYERVRIRQPWVLLRCPNNVFKMCNSASSIIAPCSDCSPHDCSWHNISTTALTPNLEVKIPVGNMDDFTHVTLITFVVFLSGCFYIMLILCKVNPSNCKPNVYSELLFGQINNILYHDHNQR